MVLHLVQAEPKCCSLGGLSLVQHVPLDEEVIELVSLGTFAPASGFTSPTSCVPCFPDMEVLQ